MSPSLPPESAVARLRAAVNAHDLDALVDCFAPDYTSEQPAHPLRAFRGADIVRQHWGAFFATIPDFAAEVLRFARHGDEEWAEWRWHGSRRDGERFEVRGVVVFRVRDGRIAEGRLFMEPVERRTTDHHGATAAAPTPA